MNWIKRIFHRRFFIRLFNWEFWSFNAVYLWIMPVWIYLSVRARSFFFFSASNPSIEYGGFLMESKKKIYDIIPPEYYPRTLYFSAGTSIPAVIDQLNEHAYKYPLIAKPDIGGKGRGVKKVDNENELIAYANLSPVNYLVQEFAPQPNEVGIFYYRYPGEARGYISGICKKELMTIKGDGKSSMYQLLMNNKRYVLQIEAMKKLYGDELQQVLPAGMQKEMVPYGNHARGSEFLDDSHLIDEILTNNIHLLCSQINGFYFGRLDIRYNTWEELRQTKNISVIELNGAGSEPTHMYDPRHGLFFGWKEIIRHWFILWRISRINHKQGIPYLSRKEGLQMFRDNTLFEKKLDQFHP